MLSPYRVLDLTDHRGQMAGFILAALGAEVIAVEPPGGSPARRREPRAGTDGPSLEWWAYNRGKSSAVVAEPAQLLSDPRDHQSLRGGVEQEFVGIILEEVERLDRVVGSVLDYARPSKGELGAVDLNAVVRRTVTVLASDRGEECEIVTNLSDDLPPVRGVVAGRYP